MKQTRSLYEFSCLSEYTQFYPNAELGYSCDGPEPFCKKIRIHHECEGGIEKSAPRIIDWHHKACRVITKGDCEGPIFLSHSHTNNGLFPCSTLSTAFCIVKIVKDFQKILNATW